jgi:hypothetical protein
MNVEFVAGVAVISDQPMESASLYQERLGLPLEGDDYLSTDKLAGVHHFGIWPLAAAAQSCFGKDQWPENLPVPTCSIEFELASAQAVAEAAAELEQTGLSLIHSAKEEPWGQTVARLMSPEGNLIGLSFAPWMH